MPITEAEISQEERARWLAATVRAAELGEMPDPKDWPKPFRQEDVVASTVAHEQEPAGETRPFTSADLTGEDVAACRKVPIGKGRHVFVFPLSGADMRALARLSSTIDPGIQQTDSPAVMRGKAEVVVRSVQPFQVVLCCYQDEERRRPCFEPRDAENVAKNLRRNVIERICAVSDELSETGVDGDLRGFFLPALASLKDWSSASATWDDCPPGLRERTRALISQWEDAV